MNAHVLVATLKIQTASDSGYLMIHAHTGRTESDIRNSTRVARSGDRATTVTDYDEW
jgi:hypothetical protein